MMNSDRFEKGLTDPGVAVDQIDYVMCTHLHVDHVGSNTRLENSRWVPTFPKAKYIFADRKLAYWTRKKQDRGRCAPVRLPYVSYPAGRRQPVANLYGKNDPSSAPGSQTPCSLSLPPGARW
jgi:glyoxylase-like metal-dependent hydrolase (beta-lactamase superfamily II)